MNEWTVVSVIIALVGLFFTVGKPIVTLNNTITLLRADIQQCSKEIEEQKKELQEQRKDAKDSHRRIWEHNDEQDGVLQDHETRIRLLEQPK